MTTSDTRGEYLTDSKVGADAVSGVLDPAILQTYRARGPSSTLLQHAPWSCMRDHGACSCGTAPDGKSCRASVKGSCWQLRLHEPSLLSPGPPRAVSGPPQETLCPLPQACCKRIRHLSCDHEAKETRYFFMCLSRTGSTEAEFGRESHHPNLREVAHLPVVFPISVGASLKVLSTRGRGGEEKSNKK